RSGSQLRAPGGAYAIVEIRRSGARTRHASTTERPPLGNTLKSGALLSVSGPGPARPRGGVARRPAADDGAGYQRWYQTERTSRHLTSPSAPETLVEQHRTAAKATS